MAFYFLGMLSPQDNNFRNLNHLEPSLLPQPSLNHLPRKKKGKKSQNQKTLILIIPGNISCQKDRHSLILSFSFQIMQR